MSFKEKKISTVQLFLGLTLVKTLEELTEDPEKGLKFLAVYLSDDETLKKFRKDPEALLPYILQAEAMDPEDAMDCVGFFSSQLIKFSQRMQSGVQNLMSPDLLKKMAKK